MSDQPLSAPPGQSVLESERKLLASIAGHPAKIVRAFEALGKNTDRLSSETHRNIFAALLRLVATDIPPTLSAVAHGFSTRGKGVKEFVAAAAQARQLAAFHDPTLNLDAELRFLGTAYGFRDALRDLPSPSAFESRHATLDAYASAVEDYARRIRDASSAFRPLTSAQLAVHLDDALRELETEEEDDSADWIIEGLIGIGSVGILAGPPQKGKSTLAVQLALCAANGRDVLNRRVAVTRRMLYLIAEGPRRQFLQRVGTAAKTLALSRPSGPWFVQAPNADVFQIGKPGFESIIASARPELCVLDTAFRFAGLDENHADEVRARVLRPLEELSRKYSTSFLLVLHSKKHGDGTSDDVAGSYALFGDTDFFFRLTVDPQNERDATLHVDKVRGRQKHTIPLTFLGDQAIFTAGREDRYAHVAEKTELRGPVLKIVAEVSHASDDRWVTKQHIGQRLNETEGPEKTSKATLAVVISGLIGDGKLEKNGRGEQYRIPLEQKVLDFPRK